jgi:hypothetical protein
MQAQPVAVAPESIADAHEEYMSFQDDLKRYDSVEGMRTEWSFSTPMSSISDKCTSKASRTAIREYLY